MFDQPPYRGSIGVGCLMVFGLNLGGGMVLFFFAILGSPILAWAPAFLGLIQLLYIVPLVRSYRRRQLPETMKGIIIGAAITFLLSATCGAMMIELALPKRS